MLHGLGGLKWSQKMSYYLNGPYEQRLNTDFLCENAQWKLKVNCKLLTRPVYGQFTTRGRYERLCFN